MTKIGYARVSTTDQDTAIQTARLKEAGCTVIRSEKVSGKTRDGRDELATVLDFLRAGDVLVVVKLDRLGRSTRDVLNLVHEIEAKGASFEVLEPQISTAGPMGRVMITVLSMVAEMELGFITERRNAGIAKAKAAGVYKGRKPSVDRDKVKELDAIGVPKAKIAKQLGISRDSVYRALA
jgi:DNA invertase Pin-like site-specific DNA recombinase